MLSCRHLGQSQIQDRRVVARHAQMILGVGDAGDEVRGKTGADQRVAQQDAEIGFVFDDEQAHAAATLHGSSLPAAYATPTVVRTAFRSPPSTASGMLAARGCTWRRAVSPPSGAAA